MVSVLFLKGIMYWIIPWILLVISYSFLLGKMGLPRATAIIPVLAERQFTKRLYPKMRTFYRPFVIALVFVLGALYLDPTVGLGRTYLWVAFVVYGFFLLRLYWRMGRAMGKGKFFRILLILVPHVFLFILALGKSQYQPLPMKPEKEHTKAGLFLRRAALVLISAAEIVVLVAGVGFLAVRDTPPALLVHSILEDTYKSTKDVTGTGTVVTREDAMGKAAASIGEMKTSREHFFPDHSNDKNVVVMTYIVGSNLEDKSGLASANIRQMMDATKQGDGLTFVLETGGSGRWFTKGIANNSVGRYTVAGGEVEKVKDLPSDTCMSEPESLTDFITWTKKKYPADRYILVLWDHGGGVPYGYGMDDLNEREGEDSIGCIRTSEVVSAIKKAGVKFDIIGFDACLMQDLEIASALEPYADYYLGSEETEGGFGWFYTSGFGKLAQAPGTPSEEFGHEMIACYDPYNTIIKDEDGEPDTAATLSFVDLTLAKPAYKKLSDLLAKAGDAVRADPADFAAMAGAAGSAYAFTDDLQIDLIDFLKILDKVDYDNTIGSHREKMELYRMIQACILYRNGNSAKGVNGMSFAFPYKAIQHYAYTSKELGDLSQKNEKKTFDEIFSIMAAQQKKDYKKKEKELEEDPSLQAVMEMLEYTDYTKEDWYVKGFEDYDQSKVFVDIPLKETPDGYQIQLPEKAWRTISDCQTMVYQKQKKDADGAVMRYLGSDHIGSDDADGHPMIAMDENWVHIGGELVCYEAQPVRETDDGDVFTGEVKARLNGKKDITLKIEWDPVEEGSDKPAQGRVTGYDSETLLDFLSETKSVKDLEAGDTIQFLFDYYDANGKLVDTHPAGGKIRITKQNRLVVEDAPLGDCDISFGGVLTDVYQRVMTTEQIEASME